MSRVSAAVGKPFVFTHLYELGHAVDLELKINTDLVFATRGVSRDARGVVTMLTILLSSKKMGGRYSYRALVFDRKFGRGTRKG